MDSRFSAVGHTGLARFFRAVRVQRSQSVDDLGYDREGTRNYAVRLWSGLVGDLYLPRWQLWIDELLLALQSNRGFSQARFDIRVKQLELQWQMQFDTKYPVQPMGNSLSIVQGLVDKYGIHYPEHYQMQVEEVTFQLQDTPNSMLEEIIGFA